MITVKKKNQTNQKTNLKPTTTIICYIIIFLPPFLPAKLLKLSSVAHGETGDKQARL